MSTANFLLLIAILTFSSCTQEIIEGVTDPNLLGTWRLEEVLADPGDGSGTFQPVDSDAEIRFLNDGTFTSNTALCKFSAQSGSSMQGTYSVSEKVLRSGDCASLTWQVDYSVDGQSLILNFFCIEPCAQKYRRVSRR
ncbi:MAG: hypothetical protein MRZ79_26105 [Bacteroidia bacterium]|nr:hypothetical protein [Bacteroidia bacterium]